jgi:transglutaminase-like putative cysteine protease
MWGQKVTFWLDENGVTLKEKGFMGLTTIKSSAARAPRDIEGTGVEDLYEMTAIKVDKILPDPVKLSSLKLQTAGIDSATIDTGSWVGTRQNFHEDILEIRREKLPSKSSYDLPYEVNGGEFKAYLAPEFNIESDHDEIKKLARRITGKERDPISASRKLMNWVYKKLEKRPVVSVPSALEVLRTRMGDCNEHATLLTALLRASGIPARLSIGLVYTRQKFFYHAWTEAYLGEWISMDATQNQMPVDVTHIKLVEGNLDKQVEIAGLIGTLKLKVLEYMRR